MSRLALALWASAALAGAETSTVKLPDGAVSIAWISPSTFHYCRAWGGQPCVPQRDAENEEVKVTVSETTDRLRLATEFLLLVIDKGNGRLRVLNSRGKALLSEPEPVARGDAGILAERSLEEGEAFYGLGLRYAVVADARGSVVESARPFLVSSEGYGLHHVGPGAYSFDLGATRPDRWRVTLRGAQQLEYYFYFGPGYKAVLDEHRLIAQPSGAATLGILRREELPEGAEVVASRAQGTWATLADAVRGLVHASLSGVPQPVFDLAPYRGADEALYRRAAQLASVSPLVCDTAGAAPEGSKARARAELADWRRRFAPFQLAYVQEIRDHGYPILHPLPLQYTSDAEARRATDQFLIGDELLAAPIYTESNRRKVYFPMGSWTDLRTNQVYPGRQYAEVEAPADTIPLFLRNGSILPLESESPGGAMVLHYTPRLAAEFFLYEPDLSEYSQAHASPALDRMRLEIDSKKARSYEWVVHHIPVVREVREDETPYEEVTDRAALRPGKWFYDRERGNLHVVVAAAAGQDHVTQVSF